MSHELLYFTFWFAVTVATMWYIRRTHRFMQESLRRIEESAEHIARFLGADRR